MTCQHGFHDPRVACPHQEVGQSGRCLWHNPAVAKSEPYVRALFNRADAGHPVWSEAHLAGLDLRDARLSGRDLSRADLRDAVLDGADLTGADLTGACLRRAGARRVILQGARLAGADLTGANLTGADLRDADLTGVILDATSLLGADLRGADLAGARVIDFRWNRLTRFQGIRGLDHHPEGADDDDATQVFLAPVAMGEEDLDTPTRLALDRPDDAARTRIFRFGALAPAAETVAAEVPPPAILATAPRRLRHLLIPVLAAFLTGGAIASLSIHRTRNTDDTAQRLTEAEQRLRAADSQRTADLAQLAGEQASGRTLAADLATARAALAASGAERGRLAEQVLVREAELGRLRDAADRAEVLALKVAELDVLNRDLAGASARQDHLSRILADGVDRFRGENAVMSTELASTRERARLLEVTQADLARTKQELAAARQERDALQGLYQGAHRDLATAKADIERYLGRIHATQFQGLLTDDSGSPLHPVVLGKPISLGGDFLVSLSIDKAEASASGASRALSVRLVVQRPAASANPDATVVLYDAEQRPLRRLSYSFPHVDAGAPFMAATSTIACDRPAAFARLILAPGEEKVAAR